MNKYVLQTIYAYYENRLELISTKIDTKNQIGLLTMGAALEHLFSPLANGPI